MIFAGCKHKRDITSLFSEAVAMKEGRVAARSVGIQWVQVETDAMALMQILNNGSDPPWIIAN